jgi:hypothetical protein
MDDDSAKCPGCGGPLNPQKACCPHCGRWMCARGFAFYTFWAVLSLIVAALIASIFHTAFLVVNRML